MQMSPTIRVEECQKLEYPNHFWSWLAKNEHIYQQFIDLALQMKRRGRKKWAAKGVIEVIRWHTALHSDGDIFKINNNYAPGLARLAMLEYKELEGFFELRNSS